MIPPLWRIEDEDEKHYVALFEDFIIYVIMMLLVITVLLSHFWISECEIWAGKIIFFGTLQ